MLPGLVRSSFAHDPSVIGRTSRRSAPHKGGTVRRNGVALSAAMAATFGGTPQEAGCLRCAIRQRCGNLLGSGGGEEAFDRRLNIGPAIPDRQNHPEFDQGPLRMDEYLSPFDI